MNKTSKLTILIPTYNEEMVIKDTLDSLKGKIQTPFEVLIVDDSTDLTERVVKKYMQSCANVRYIKNKKENRGFSNSLMRALRDVSTDVFVIMMGDLCDDPLTVDKMYKKTQKGWDIVCGSRYIKGGKKMGGPKLQGFLSMLVCRTLYLLTNIPTHDVSNNFKMYKKSSLKGVRFNPVSGVETSMEITFQAYFNGMKITEVPTVWKGRDRGNSKFNVFQRTPKYFKIYVWAIANRFRQVIGINLKDFYV